MSGGEHRAYFARISRVVHHIVELQGEQFRKRTERDFGRRPRTHLVDSSATARVYGAGSRASTVRLSYSRCVGDEIATSLGASALEGVVEFDPVTDLMGSNLAGVVVTTDSDT